MEKKINMQDTLYWDVVFILYAAQLHCSNFSYKVSEQKGNLFFLFKSFKKKHKNLIWSGTSKVYFSLKNKIPFSAKGWHIFISMIAQVNTILTFIFLVHHFLSILNKKWFLWKPWRLDKGPRRGLCSCPVFMTIFAYVFSWGLLSVHFVFLLLKWH